MKIPKKIKDVLKELEKNNFQGFLVGGCVRDLLREIEPKDWDITTNATPKEIQKVFPDNFYENDFGTVTVLPARNATPHSVAGGGDVEITPFRTEAKYTDKRHPDKVDWAKTIDEDLSRRDFTVNAMALRLGSGQATEIIDLFDGQKDLDKKLIKAVGSPKERFNEDALRMMRAIRFASVLGFSIEEETSKAIKENATLMKVVSQERIRDEFVKIVMSDKASEGIELLRTHNLLEYVVPELLEGYEVDQSKHHIYDCYKHSINSLKYAAKKGFNKHVRIASLLHDIGKPKSKRGVGEKATFYGHEVVGARMTKKILERLKFPKKDIEKIVKLVRYHLFYYNVDEVTEASVRKLVRKVGADSINDLLQVRMSDRIGSGVPKAEPYKLRHMKYIIEKSAKDPISVKMLKVNGEDIIKMLKIKPSQKIGWILDVLLGHVLEEPENNKKTFLKKEVERLGKLSDKELESLSLKAQEERNKIITKEDKMTKDKYWLT